MKIGERVRNSVRGREAMASAVAIVMLLLLIVPIMWFHKHQQKQMGDHG